MSAPPPLGKHLASSDKSTRDKAVNGLTAFLCHESNARLSDKDMAKLWKGIFYCFWMSDKPLVQQALATDLSNIILAIPTLDASFAFLGGFWEAMVREWDGLDRYRLDKFYMLIRRYVNATFRLLMREQWAESPCSSVNDILTRAKGPLYPHDVGVPKGLTYHLADIYLEELNKVLFTVQEEELAPSLPKIIDPFLRLASETSNDAIFARINKGVLRPLLSALRKASPSYTTTSTSDPRRARKRPRMEKGSHRSEDDEDQAEDKSEADADAPLYFVVRKSRGFFSDGNESSKALPPKDLLESVLKAIFDAASRDTSKDSRRRRLYALWKSAKANQDDV
ncbi:ribosomal RNA processing protein [Cantharellus anzutake]|uniref:ribosomal RNA processing protein n=1 Tax=Cantharellus anzutake TaxID=1750568 RepID=UPI001907A155|nr:ribosomal RNA processing protein [Cantharellus anzutake]KAF8332631.1 ribosomal RNA processing protein [Cantharellus anzutake]